MYKVFILHDTYISLKLFDNGAVLYKVRICFGDVKFCFFNFSVHQVSDYHDDIKPMKPPPLPPFYQDAGYSGNHHAHPPPPGIEPVTLPSRLQTEPPPPGTDVEGQMLSHRQTQLVMDDYQTQAQSR